MWKDRTTSKLMCLILLGATVGLGGAFFIHPTYAQSVDMYGSTPLYKSQSVQSLGTIHEQGNSPEISHSTEPLDAPPPYTSDEALQPVKVGAVTYLTGGIGDEELNYLHNVAKDYNLHISSASHGGAYLGDTHILIRDHKRDVLLDANAGPIFLAKLAPGTYTIEASHDGQIMTKSINVNRKSATAHFSW